jgi:hypothetical protein
LAEVERSALRQVVLVYAANGNEHGLCDMLIDG